MLLLLPFVLAVAAPVEVAVLPVLGAEGQTQDDALQRVAAAAIERNRAAHTVREGRAAGGFDIACRDAPCLSHHSGTGRQVVFIELVGFGQSWTVSLYAWDPAHSAEVRTATRTSPTADALPQTVEALVDDLWPRPAVASVSALAKATQTPEAEGTWTPTFALNPKVGNVFPGFTGSHLQITGLSPRLDLEVDYYALPSFLTFVDASLVFASASTGQSINLVPVLLGAKYLFRDGSAFRPYLGIGLGLGFLTSSLNSGSATSASFAVYSVLGLAYFPWQQVGFNIEGSVNLTGLEVSASSGVLFALSGDLGVVFVF
jgi:outer membrane protein W